LEGKIKSEMVSLKEKMAKMEEELLTYSDLVSHKIQESIDNLCITDLFMLWDAIGVLLSLQAAHILVARVELMGRCHRGVILVL
jgi:hypothetical protein